MSEEKINYLTIAQGGENTIIIKKSRFICSLKRTTTVDEANEFIKECTTKFRDATHNTFAYTIGLNNDQVKASDNGEPSGTAGVPELKALELMKVKNVTAVVTRYFGGIKLGAGGLIRAYSNSVTQAVEKVGVVKCCLQQEISCKISYPNLDIVNNFLEKEDIFVSDRQYGTDVTIKVFIDLENVEDFRKKITNLLSGNIDISLGDKRYNEIPVKDNNFHEQ